MEQDSWICSLNHKLFLLYICRNRNRSSFKVTNLFITMTLTRVNYTILTTQDEVICRIAWKSQSCNRDGTRLFRSQFHRFLDGEQILGKNRKISKFWKNEISKFLGRNEKRTWGLESISRLHEHILPSVETEIKLCAFWLPFQGVVFKLSEILWKIQISTPSAYHV